MLEVANSELQAFLGNQQNDANVMRNPLLVQYNVSSV